MPESKKVKIKFVESISHKTIQLRPFIEIQEDKFLLRVEDSKKENWTLLEIRSDGTAMVRGGLSPDLGLDLVGSSLKFQL